jgi:hypothetical protein
MYCCQVKSNYCVIWLILFQLWLINPGEAQKKGPTASYQNSLSYHGSAVNILRFSPSGKDTSMRFNVVCFVKMWVVSIIYIAIVTE